MLSATSLGIVVPVLADAGQSRSTLGQLIISASSIADFGAVILLSLFFSGDSPCLSSSRRRASGRSPATGAGLLSVVLFPLGALTHLRGGKNLELVHSPFPIHNSTVTIVPWSPFARP